jgi:hypothetical protein
MEWSGVGGGGKGVVRWYIHNQLGKNEEEKQEGRRNRLRMSNGYRSCNTRKGEEEDDGALFSFFFLAGQFRSTRDDLFLRAPNVIASGIKSWNKESRCLSLSLFFWVSTTTTIASLLFWVVLLLLQSERKVRDQSIADSTGGPAAKRNVRHTPPQSGSNLFFLLVHSSRFLFFYSVWRCCCCTW